MYGERLKNAPVGASAVPDYFDEMLERIIYLWQQAAKLVVA